MPFLHNIRQGILAYSLYYTHLNLLHIMRTFPVITTFFLKLRN